jgi:putative zinc finger protein
MTCTEFEVLLVDYVDGAVTIDERRAVEAHADNCAACREMLRDVFQAVSFLEAAEEVTPPPELITRIASQAPQGRVKDEFHRNGLLSRIFSKWFQPVLQPRFAMSMAMTILSLAMVERCTGIHTQQISAADLNPAVLWNGLEEKAYRTWDRTVKYYENLRLVYEVETALREIREQQDTAPASQSPAQKDSKTGDRQPKTESSPK